LIISISPGLRYMDAIAMDRSLRAGKLISRFSELALIAQ
jgi:hypothetical protein